MDNVFPWPRYHRQVTVGGVAVIVMQLSFHRCCYRHCCSPHHCHVVVILVTLSLSSPCLPTRNKSGLRFKRWAGFYQDLLFIIVIQWYSSAPNGDSLYLMPFVLLIYLLNSFRSFCLFISSRIWFFKLTGWQHSAYGYRTLLLDLLLRISTQTHCYFPSPTRKPGTVDMKRMLWGFSLQKLLNLFGNKNLARRMQLM